MATSGFVSCGVITGLADVPTLDSRVTGVIFAGAGVVFIVSTILGAIWAAAVLIRQLALRWPRRRALKRMAAQLGWQWYPSGRSIPPDLQAVLHGLRPGPQDNQRKPKYSEALRGTFAGASAVACHFERGVSYELEVDQLVALALPGSLPDLLIIDRAEDAYGVSSDQQFESARFNHLWRVETEDHRYGSAFTHPQLMELLGSLDLSVTEIRVRGNWLISHAPTAFTPELLRVHLDALARIAAAVPAWVWQDFGHAVPGRGPASHR